MTLSEEELRVLQQMEQALVEEDPKFASTLRGTRLGRAVKLRALAAGTVFVVGAAVLMTGAVTARTWLGIVGFVIMLASATLGLAAWKGRSNAPTQPQPQSQFVPDSPAGLSMIQGGKASKRPKAAKSKPPKSGSFMSRFEDRWQRRRQRGGF